MEKTLKNNNRKIIFIVALLGNILVWNFFLSLPDGRLHLKVYDVGQGDSLFIETAGGFRILIDGGPNTQVADYLGRDVPFYSKKLDLVILTHPESDHLTGLLEVVKQYQINSLWISDSENDTRLFQEWEKLLKEKAIPIQTVSRGDRIVFPDGTTVSVLWPTKGLSASNLNSLSVVVQISYVNFDAILTGDADSKVQPFTSNANHIEAFKVPHHGSKTALKEEYISSISPEISFISVGVKNPYGHPSLEVIGILNKLGSKVYRTDKNGSGEIVSDGKSWYSKWQHD